MYLFGQLCYLIYMILFICITCILVTYSIIMIRHYWILNKPLDFVRFSSYVFLDKHLGLMEPKQRVLFNSLFQWVDRIYEYKLWILQRCHRRIMLKYWYSGFLLAFNWQSTSLHNIFLNIRITWVFLILLCHLENLLIWVCSEPFIFDQSP